MTHQDAQQFKAALAVAKRVRSDNPDLRVDIGHGDLLDDTEPCCIATDGGYLVEAWVFVCAEAVAEELSAETVQRLEVA